MAPKNKYTKTEIIDVAIEMVREQGMECVTARALGERLHTSSRPLFTAFQNMEELWQEVQLAIQKRYHQYVSIGLQTSPAFKGVGMQYIRFAIEEPKLFQLLFMKEKQKGTNINDILPLIEDHYNTILHSIINDYNLSEKKALALYQHLWIYTHGIATLCATGMCEFSETQISDMLSAIFIPLLKEYMSYDQN